MVICAKWARTWTCQFPLFESEETENQAKAIPSSCPEVLWPISSSQLVLVNSRVWLYDKYLFGFYLQYLADISPPQKKGYKNWNYFPPKADHRNCSLCVLELAMETLSGLSFTSCQRGLSIPWKKERCIEAKKTEKTDRPYWVFSPSLLRVGDTVKSS